MNLWILFPFLVMGVTGTLAQEQHRVDEITFEHKPSTGYLTMLFSAPVDTVRINCDQRQFTYQDAMLMPNKTFSPHRPGSCFQSSVTQITFILDTEDYVELLNEECLFRSNATAVLAWNDTLGTAYNITSGQLVISFVGQNPIQPSILSFDLDMTDGVFVFFFGSIMDVTTLNLTYLTLQSGRHTLDPQLNMPQGLVLNTQHYSTTLCLALFADQLQSLRNNSEVCKGTQSCYISFTSSVIMDANRNAIIPVTQMDPLMVSKYRSLESHEEGFLQIELHYLGCTRHVNLYNNEVLIVRALLRESLRSVKCYTGNNSGGQLSWKNGGQNGTVTPFTNINVSFFDFPNGLSPKHYGVFSCTWIHGNITKQSQNYIVDENPFAGIPDGSVITPTLYHPVAFNIHYGAVPHVYDSAFVASTRVGEVTSSAFNTSLEDLYLSIWVEYTNVLYSLSGHYVANITSTAGDHPDLVFEFAIDVEDPTVEISTSAVEVDTGKQSLSLFCTPSSRYLPVIWREGNIRLMSSDTGITLSPPNLHHNLSINLTTHNLTGQNIVCEVIDPEGLRDVVASAQTTIFLPSGTYCEADTDLVWSIEWEKTSAGVTAEADCPQLNQDQMVSGLARRVCLESGTWEYTVNISACANVQISSIAEQVEIALSVSDVATSDQLLSFLLHELTEALAPNGSLIIFPQDLTTSNTIVGKVVSKLRGDVENNIALSLHTDIFDVINKMLVEENREAWRTVEMINNHFGSSTLLQNAENYAQYVTEALLSDVINTTMDGNSVILKRDTIEMAVQILGNVLVDTVYPPDEDERSEDAQIRIPAHYLTAHRVTAVVNMLFSTLNEILPNENEANTQPASMVLSSQVVARKDSNENPVVELNFRTSSIAGAEYPRCAYWDYNKRDWLTEGIDSEEVERMGFRSYSYEMSCTSSHLTAFAVIVDINEENDVPVVSFIGGTVLALLSLLSFVVIVIRFFKDGCTSKKPDIVHYFAYLCFFASMLIAEVVFLVGHSESIKSEVLCTALAALLQYFFTALICWVLILAFLSLVTFESLLCLLLFGFGLPLVYTGIFVTALVLQEQYATEKFCWISIEKIEAAPLWLSGVLIILSPMVMIFLILLIMGLRTRPFITEREDSPIKKKIEKYTLGFAIFLTFAVCIVWIINLLMVNTISSWFKWLFMIISFALGITFIVGSAAEVSICRHKNNEVGPNEGTV